MKKIFSILGMIASAIIAFGGFVLHGQHISSYLPDYSFGADFYTEMYSITRDAASNIISASNAITEAISVLIIALGVIGFFYFGVELGKTNEKVIMPEPIVEPARKSVNRKGVLADDYDFLKVDDFE